MILESAHYVDGVPRDEELSAAEAGRRAREGSGFVWLAVADPSAAELEQLRTAFDLPRLAVEDVREGHQRAKLERYPQTDFIVVKTVRYDDAAKGVEVSELELFVGAGYAIVTSPGNSSPFGGVRERLKQSREIARVGPMAAAWALLDTVVDAYEPVLDRLGDDLEFTEQAVFGSDLEQGEQIYKQRRAATHVARVLYPLAGIFDGLKNDQSPDTDPLRPLLRDVSDHVHRLGEEARVLSEALDGLLNANLSRVTVHQNRVVQKVSSWAAILAIPTIITGIYGMNFRHMPELGWRFGYPLALVVMIAAVLGLRRYFKHVGWL
jgi:magnesium transporter